MQQTSFSNRLHEKNTANNGHEMKIIAYRSSSDIDIEFDTGDIVYKKNYVDFKRGQIALPKKSRIGEINETRDGRRLEIVAYRKANDIDVRFEDGTIVEHRSYHEFIKKHIGYPLQDRVGEISVSKMGQKMKIVRYGGSRDVDVEFEDGTIVINKEYKSFVNGGIANPNFGKSKIGEMMQHSSGMLMFIVAWRSAKDIDIEFEDGVRVYHKDYYSFVKANIGYPIEDRMGESSTANNGMNMKIIAYRSSADIDIEFEDGAKVYHKSYLNFKNGSIGYPKPNHIGEESICKNGLKMTIIEYRNSGSIDIKFEDGTIVNQRSYQNFIKGAIAYPIENRVGVKRVASNGLLMEIIEYRSATDIDVEFEDGIIVQHKDYKSFLRGQVGHPYMRVHRSLPEKILCYFIGREYDYLPNYKPDWLLDNKSREDNKKTEIDIYIPSIGWGMEYDGCRFHQEAEKDNIKTKSIIEHGVNLIRIREDGCPELQKYEKQYCIDVNPFSIYHKETLESLEVAISKVFNLFGKEKKIEINQEVIEHCRSIDFYNSEKIMIRRIVS